MPINWGELLKVIIPSAAGVTGAVLGNRAQAGAINASKEELAAARAASANWLRQALEGAQPYADWNLGEQRAGSDWAYSGGQDALDLGYGRGSALMMPYAEAGQNALGRLASAAASTPRVTSYKGFSPSPPSPSPALGRGEPTGGGPWPSPPPFSPVARTAFPRTAPPKFSVPGGAGGNALAANAAGGPAGFDLGDNEVPGSKFGPGTGAATGAAVGSFVPGLGTAVGAGAGALVGALVSRFTRAGRERIGATEAVKEYSNWVWNEVMPQYRAGKLTREEANAAIEAGWGQYTNWLDQNVKDSDVNRNSKTSQRAWLDEGLNGPNGWASGPPQGVA